MQAQIHVSTTFFPSAILPGVSGRSDIIFHTRDLVFFYCHKSILASRSTNNFGHAFSSPHVSGAASPVGTPNSPGAHQSTWTPLDMIVISEAAEIFNIILLITYRLPCSRYAPSLEVITQALTSLHKYGCSPPHDDADLWSVLMERAPAAPMRVYALCALCANETMCRRASSYTLTVSLDTATEADALMMGAVYYRRLALLHQARRDALRDIITEPPAQHPPTDTCTTEDQTAMVKQWKTAIADTLSQNHLQNLQPDALTGNFWSVAAETTCTSCRDAIRDRIATVLHDWVTVKATI
ncbi:hypothetical protein FRB99_008971 [Tulasnella sp. 403]|nr:hypothetical protein FRB99_008971 [Tulasnella sp. 403]